MKEEPESVMESMFSSLLELASRSGAPIAINGNIESGAHIRALSYSCLLALAVAGESTGHLMRSTAALSQDLMQENSFSCREFMFTNTRMTSSNISRGG